MSQDYEDTPILLKKATALFKQRFEQEPTVAVYSPGRVNLIGDHVDYNGGFVLPMAIPMGTVIIGALNKLSICRVETDSKGVDDPTYVEFDIPSATSAIEPGNPKWSNYVKGVVAGFHETVKGFDCVIVSSIPVGAGLSSSAAIEVATYTLLEELLNSPSSSLKEKALACQKAEHLFAGCPCGIMDQFVCTHAKKDCALLLDCKTMIGENVPLDDPSVCILIINSGVKHELSGSEYPLRRAQCEQAAKSIGVSTYLRDVSRKILEESKKLLDSEVYRRALHVINETEYTLEFVEFLKEKKYAEAGQCMIKSHKSLSDLYNVSCNELDLIVDIASKVDGVYGARMTGGGFGGCVVALAKTDTAISAMETIRKQCESQSVYPTLYICNPCEGAHRFN